MKKIQEKGDEYIGNESERLERMISKLFLLFLDVIIQSSFIIVEGGISAKKKDEFTKRRNVLKKFEL